MAVTVTHTKVSTIPDDADTSLIRPSDWNATHTLTGLGTMATQDSNNVSITGGSITGVTGLGTVTSVSTGTGLSGGPITSTGTVSFSNANVATWAATPTSANLAAAVSDETGSGSLVFGTSPTISSATISSGTINNASVGATTASTGAFTYLSTSSTTSTTPVLSYNATNTNLALGASVASTYLQSVMQNKSATAGASTNFAVSNNLGTDSTYYGEFGMNSSVFSASTPADFFSINNGVYYSGHDGDISIGSGNGYKTYFAWGTTGQSAHVINVTGAIGLNTNLGTTPALSGTTNFGTAGQVLTSQGSAATPTWTTPTTGTVTSVTGTSPVVSSGGNTPAISMPAATTSVNGYLTSTDWTTFNNKGSGSVTSVAALTLGTTGTDLTSTVATGTTTPVITLNVPTASASNRGVLSAADWTTFNNKGSGTVTSVTGTAPVVSSGGTTPAISMAAATTSVNGYLTSTDWNTFNNKGSGTVTAVSVVSANGFAGSSSGGATPALTLSTSITGMLKGNGTAISAGTAGTDYVAPGTATTFTALQTFSGSTSVAALKVTNIKEVITVSATAATGTINYDVTTQSILYYTSNASANWTTNFRGSSGTSMDTLMSTGEAIAVTFMVTQGATAYYNNVVQVDGTTSGVTTKWQGGAPTSGNASGIDAYNYVIIKTGSATFTVIASQTQFK